MKTVNYLDIALNLGNSTYCPYQTLNLTTHHLSYQATSALYRISTFIIILLRSNLQRLPYQDALDKSGYKHKLKYKANIDTASNKKQRKRNIIWFNPPNSKNVKTNIGKRFLNLIKKHFPPHHKFNNVFNKNTVKNSYSCTRNIKTIMNSHNAKILSLKKALNKEHAIA